MEELIGIYNTAHSPHIKIHPAKFVVKCDYIEVERVEGNFKAWNQKLLSFQKLISSSFFFLLQKKNDHFWIAKKIWIFMMQRTQK